MRTFFTQTLLCSCLALFAFNAFSQERGGPPHEGMEDIDIEGAKALKIAIYTEVLDLTEAEAQKFWPIFNEFEKKQAGIRDEMNTIRKEVELKFKDLTDKELEEKIDQMMVLRKKEVELTEEYYEKYKQVLPIRKVALMHKAEMMYKRALLRKVREQHQGRR